ncbi:MAG: hypothetical protein ACJAVI_004590 [Candidatus Azotimanducaceae bacterium]|jgi:hypothetical protein
MLGLNRHLSYITGVQSNARRKPLVNPSGNRECAVIPHDARLGTQSLDHANTAHPGIVVN